MHVVLPWQPVSTGVNYESFYRYNGTDSLAVLSDGLNFKITSDSFNLRWQLFVAFPIKEKQKELAG